MLGLGVAGFSLLSRRVPPRAGTNLLGSLFPAIRGKFGTVHANSLTGTNGEY